MAEDEIASAEEDVFYEYAVPSEIGQDRTDSGSKISNLTTDPPREPSSSETPPRLTGEGAQSTLTSITDHPSSALRTDVVSIVRRAITIHIPRAISDGKVELDAETVRTLISRLLVAAIYIAGFALVVFSIPILMAEDEIVSMEEDVFYEYTIPSDIGPDGLDSASNISNLTTDLPRELSSEVPSQITGEGAQSTLTSIINYLNSTLGIDLVSIARIFFDIIVIVIATYLAAKMVKRAITIHLPKVIATGKTGLDAETEMTFRTLISRLLVAAIYIVGFLLVISRIPTLNSLAVTLLAGAGVAGLAIGFAAQDSLSNVISGIFLAVFHPFRVGDYIDFSGEYGQIEDLTLRHTTIRTWDGRRIFVPNSIMGNQPIINWSITDPVITWRINVGIAYTADIDKARDIMLEVAKRHPLVLKNHEITVRVTELGDFAVNMRLGVDVPNRDVAWTTGCEIMESIKKRFDKEGIEIPYPYRNLIIQNPLRSSPSPEGQDPLAQEFQEMRADQEFLADQEDQAS
jgi:small conductance mechanosensitive channel